MRRSQQQLASWSIRQFDAEASTSTYTALSITRSQVERFRLCRSSELKIAFRSLITTNSSITADVSRDASIGDESNFKIFDCSCYTQCQSPPPTLVICSMSFVSGRKLTDATGGLKCTGDLCSRLPLHCSVECPFLCTLLPLPDFSF